jgi:hypothetical protein
MKTTIIFKQVSVGTEINIVQEGIPEVIPTEACYPDGMNRLCF